eukprot:scaffold76019_cov66-Phaeocystis_antarctica.AAC.8
MHHLPIGVLVGLVCGQAGRLIVLVARVELAAEDGLVLLLPLLDVGEALRGGVDEVLGLGLSPRHDRPASLATVVGLARHVLVDGRLAGNAHAELGDLLPGQHVGAQLAVLEVPGREQDDRRRGRSRLDVVDPRARLILNPAIALVCRLLIDLARR